MDRRAILGLGVAAALIAGVIATLSLVVVRREGNLGWDDADYLRKGLRIANRAAAAGPHGLLLAADDLYLERPKPPLLIGWIAASTLVLGRDSTTSLILAASVVPFGLLLCAAANVARRRFGPWAAVAAIAAIVASPLVVSLGGKVMVETFLCLAILLALDAMARTLEKPTVGRAFGLGAAIGMGMMTKLTIALLLPGPAVAFAYLYVRRHGFDRRFMTIVAVALLGVAVVAGPWYFRNGRAAVAFARFSSEYNVEAQGRPSRVPALDRLTRLAAAVPGWPAVAVIAILGGVVVVTRRCPGRPIGDFPILAAASLGGGAIGLLIPTYFDPRFLAPAWPASAVAIAALFARSADSVRRPWMALPAALLFAGAGWSFVRLANEPQSTTFWAARDLIDEMVGRYGVHSIGNVGTTSDWNVCKTGLINEMRDAPDSCFVLRDLSRARPSDLAERLAKLDAVVVLADSPRLRDVILKTPGLNAALKRIDAAIIADGRFVRVEPTALSALPPMSVYVRR